MESEALQNNEKLCLNGFIPVTDSPDPLQLSPVSEKLNVSKISCSDDLQSPPFNSEIPTLQRLFKEIYAKKLLTVENGESDSSLKQEEKISILQAYVQHLEEQNDVLVTTMLELEKEAHQRVKQMENRLKSSAKSTMETVINVHDFEQEMRKLVNERLQLESMLENMQHYLSSLKVENGYLRDQSFNLNHDVQALLHIIHHARSTGHWEMDCVTFCEVTPEQVFGPVQSLSQLYASESPQFSKVIEKERKVFVSSNTSSQDVSHSSMSSPSADTPLGLTQFSDGLQNVPFFQEARQEIMKRDKAIAILETHLADIQHQLSVREAECECHLWKIEALMQQNQKNDGIMNGTLVPSMRSLIACDTSLPKCISLPDIGNIYSYDNVMRKSHSCRTIIDDYYRLNHQFPTKVCHVKPKQKAQDLKNKPSKAFVSKPESVIRLQKSQSEPHLYMVGDNVYVYRPCEQIKKTSNYALNEDFQSSFPLCQSIDLKFPTGNSNLKVCDWDFVHNPNNYSVPVGASQLYNKVDMSNSSCTTSESGDAFHSKSIPTNGICLPNNCYIPSLPCNYSNCTNYPTKNNIHSPESVSSSSINDTSRHLKLDSNLNCKGNAKVAVYSIGLQADLEDVVSKSNVMNENVTTEIDVREINKRMQILKHNLLKAEDKAAAKEILIEQLQGHISTAFKEVEMKDEVLHNIEKKLITSRSGYSSLKEKVTSLESEIQRLLSDLKNAKLLNDSFQSNIDMGKKQIEEIRDEQKTLQDQKRALMTQLDAQGDKLHDTQKEFEIMKLKAQSYAVQIEQQNQIIKSLQEALVQSKRAFDAAHQNKPLLPNNVNLQTKDRQFSKSSIVDI